MRDWRAHVRRHLPALDIRAEREIALPVAAALACWVPALRATAINPVDALRSE